MGQSATFDLRQGAGRVLQENRERPSASPIKDLMTRTPISARRLRLGAAARWVAVLAMLVQVVFFAEHLGAAAVHQIGHLAPGARLGFLQICTGEGIALLDPASGKIVQPPAGPAPSHGECAVCTSASVCSFALPGVAAATLPVPVFLASAEPALPAPFAIFDPVARTGLIRAPPQA